MVESNERIYPKKVSGEIKCNRTSIVKKGAFGIVFRGVYNNKNVRVKRIAVDRVQQQRHNVDLQVELNHKNVVKLLTVEGDDDFWYYAIICFLFSHTSI